MHKRSLGVTVLAFGTVMVALYSQYAAISLLLTGSVFTVAGSFVATLTLLTGAVFLGVTATAYVVAFGLWSRRAWSWNGGMAVYLTFFAANVVLSILAANFVSALLPSIAVIAAVFYLHKPAVRAEVLGEEPTVTARSGMPDGLETAKLAR